MSKGVLTAPLECSTCPYQWSLLSFRMRSRSSMPNNASSSLELVVTMSYGVTLQIMVNWYAQETFKIQFVMYMYVALFQIKWGLKMDASTVVSKQKCIDYIDKWQICIDYIHVVKYNLYIFVWTQHSCLADRVFPVDPSHSIIIIIIIINCSKIKKNRNRPWY